MGYRDPARYFDSGLVNANYRRASAERAIPACPPRPERPHKSFCGSPERPRGPVPARLLIERARARARSSPLRSTNFFPADIRSSSPPPLSALLPVLIPRARRRCILCLKIITVFSVPRRCLDHLRPNRYSRSSVGRVTRAVARCQKRISLNPLPAPAAVSACNFPAFSLSRIQNWIIRVRIIWI